MHKLRNTGNSSASGITFTPDGDLAATNVQDALEEVRDDTDTKLSAKADSSDLADYVTTDTAQEITAEKDFSAGIKTDTISESTEGRGVTVDGVQLKDSAIEAGADTDITCTLGRAKIGYNGSDSDQACFGHYDNFGEASYNLKANSLGDLEINCKNGRGIYFKINDILKHTLQANSFLFTTPIYNQVIIDADFDDEDVIILGVTNFAHGLFMAKEVTTNKNAMLRFEHETVNLVDGDSSFSTTKDNAGTINIYFDSESSYFRIQNKTGNNNLDVTAGFYAI